MRADLAALPLMRVLAEQIDAGERFTYLDAATQIKLNPKGALSSLSGSSKPIATAGAVAEKVVGAAADWNRILRMGNSWYDRLVDACRKPTRTERKAAIQGISRDVDAVRAAARAFGPSMLLNPRDRISRWLGSILFKVLSPAIVSVADSEGRAATQFELAKLGFALAAYRAEKGAYPAKLADLTPKYVATVPKDPFNDQDLHYTQQGEGYLLYSVGVNGKDDGGKGQADRKAGEDWDDLAIRVPAETPKK